MKRITLIFLCALLLLCGCSPQTPSAEYNSPKTENTGIPTADTPNETKESPESANEETQTEETLAPDTQPEETDALSHLAEKNYLLPLENYSWENEYPIEFIVIHFVSDVVNSRDNPYSIERVKDIFLQTKVSTNYIIDRDGSISCFIPEDRSAWHAGAGQWKDDERLTNKMNKYSIGIELLAIGSQKDMAAYLSPDEYNAIPKELIGFTDEQYASLKELLKDICQRHSIEYSRQYIIGHSEYNTKKSDPGELFDWSKLFE